MIKMKQCVKLISVCERKSFLLRLFTQRNIFVETIGLKTEILYVSFDKYLVYNTDGALRETKEIQKGLKSNK